MSQKINFNRLENGFPSILSWILKGYQLSSAALFIMIAPMLWIAQLSLQSTYRFSEARYWLFHPVGKIFIIIASTLCFYHSLVSLYTSIVSSCRVSPRPMASSIIVLALTIYLAGGLTYWLW